MTQFSLNATAIKKMLNELAQNDSNIQTAIELVGYPDERRRDHGFPTLLRIISGQQLSVKAAASIHARVEALVDGPLTPEKMIELDDETLRSAGCSRQKITYIRSLCDAVLNGPLDLEKLPKMSDDEALAAITYVKGLGRWSAEMYLMFSLGRLDIWPVDDLAVRVGAGRIINLEERPTAKELDVIGERWRPYRSSVALLAWRYYANAPM